MKKFLQVLCTVFAASLWMGIFFLGWGYSRPEAGFYSLEENCFYFHNKSYFNRIVLRSSPARIWYAYQPADFDPEVRPLFVFYNGGPGSATSNGLFSANTGRIAVKIEETSGAGILVENPSSWTRIGNLLYIDSRTSGFSYSLMDDPSDDSLRRAEFDAQNYNCFTDGADFVRVLLRFLADHPQIQRNPVILVPESYGGIRTIVMLHILLYYRNYENGWAVYQNSELADEIQDHFDIVFPEYDGQTVPPDVVSRQFSHQVMIQVAISHPYQRQVAVRMLEALESPLYRLAEETGIPYVPWGDRPGADGSPIPNQIMDNIYAYLDAIDRDPYIFSKPGGYFSGHRAVSEDLLTHYDSLCLMTGVDAAGIPELYALSRQQGYKTRLAHDPHLRIQLSAFLGPVPAEREIRASLTQSGEGDLGTIFGMLQPWDRYFLNSNYNVPRAFYINRANSSGYDVYYAYSNLFGRMFLETAAWVHTFITNAAFDVVVYSPAIPEALGLHTDILNSVFHDRIGPPGAERPGRILLDYNPGSVPNSTAVTRCIRFPRYTKSGHAVPLTEPAEMLADVVDWLGTTGMEVNSRGGKGQ